MAESYRQWLATKVLSDQQTVSYRVLARGLKVHVNDAKKMLYEFHRHENTKKASSVHATYLISGLKRLEDSKVLTNGNSSFPQEQDSPIPSSPPPFTSSMLDPDEEPAEQKQVQTISLVREESLEAVKTSFSNISCIHVYSVSPNRLSDLQTLTDSARDLFTTYFSKEDPLEHNATYGVIINPSVRRRTVRRPPPPAAPLAKAIPKPTKVAAPPARPASTKSEDPSSRPSSAGSSSPSTSSKPTLKRDTSDIFRAFAKNKAKKPPPAPAQAQAQGPPQGPPQATTGRSTPSTSSRPLSRASKTAPSASDSEGASDDPSPTASTSKKRSSTSKADRAAKLRKMMDSDGEDDGDQEMTDAPPASATHPAPSKAEKQESDGEEIEWSESDPENFKPKNSAQTAAATKSDNAVPERRRGRRKVTKKKTTMDDEGYLVTKEEVAWESFSEEEGAVKRVVVGPKDGGKAIAKGGAKEVVKGGKGEVKPKRDIASFFKR